MKSACGVRDTADPEGIAIAHLVRTAAPYAAAISLIVVLPVAFDNPYLLNVLQTIGIYAIAAIGLNILVGFAGLKSLGHGGFFAIGAYASVLLPARFGMAVLPAMILAMTIAAVVGAVVALPTLRATGPYVAMITLAFALIVSSLAIRLAGVTNGPAGIFDIHRPDLYGTPLDDRAYFYLIAGIAFTGQLAAATLLRGPVGRALLAVQGSEVAAEVIGVNVYLWKITAFIIAAAYGGLAGALFGHQTVFLNSDPFSIDLSIELLAMVILGGAGTLLGPIVGSAALELLVQFLSAFPLILPLLTGTVLVVAIIAFPRGIVGSVRDRMLRPTPYKRPERDYSPWLTRSAAGPILELTNIARRFGGLTALDGLDLVVHPGTVHALIGPNGSGKSTAINLITGIYAADSGSITYKGSRLPRHVSPHQIARKGVTRTFQTLRLFPGMSVLDNVLVGREATPTSRRPQLLPPIVSSWRQERANREIALSLLAFLGLGDVAHLGAMSLPYGQQRLVEIARALGTRPALLILDEPAAGMSEAEIDFLRTRLQRLRESGITILLIEHHMDFVLGIADTITVLDHGRTIAEGPPDMIRTDPRVVGAYLGPALEATDA